MAVIDGAGMYPLLHTHTHPRVLLGGLEGGGGALPHPKGVVSATRNLGNEIEKSNFFLKILKIKS